MTTWAQFENEARDLAPTRDLGDAKVAGTAIEVTGEAKNAYATGSEPDEDFHAFRLDLSEAVVTSVEGDELVVRVWHPGQGVQTFRRT
jgi:hypothetical protein